QPRDCQQHPWSSASSTLTNWDGRSSQGTVSSIPGAQPAAHSPTGMTGAAKGLSAASLELSQQHTHRLGWQEQPRDCQQHPWSSASSTLT
ncbi:hypothetical protein FRB93_010523, partial [Tulasnella sp. JGI-2019a]